MSSHKTVLSTMLLAGLVAAIVSASVAGGLLFVRGFNDEPGVAGASGGDKQAIEAQVRDYLINNPEILIEMSQQLEERQAAVQATALRGAIAENSDTLFRSENAPIVGNPKGDVTVVEFFDYNCGYCKRALDDVVKLVESDANVRVVLKEFPILRRESEGAARIALAAIKQGKYFELHQALLAHQGMNSEESALKVAAELGLDIEKLKQDKNAPEVEKALAESRALAQKIGVQGTPYYLIGDRVVPGAPEDLFEQLTAKVAEIRKNGCDASISC